MFQDVFCLAEQDCAAAMALCCIGSAWLGFLISGPASRDDAMAFMVSVFVPPFVFWGFDYWVGRVSGLSIVLQPGIPGAVGERERGEHGNAENAIDGGLTFRLRSLFAWITLVAIGVALWKSAATMNAVAFRDIRGFLMESPINLLVRLLFWVAVHGLVIVATLKPGVRWAWWVLIPSFAGGLEGIRRYFSNFSITVGYLEWDFAMLSLGFVVGQILLGLAIRSMGWVGVRDRG